MIAALDPAAAHDDRRLPQRLAPFLIAGLHAPLPGLTRADPAIVAVRRRQGRQPGPTNKAGRSAVVPVGPAPGRGVDFGRKNP